jgi:glycosyltransferase involved in cell wall biosynthesis
MGRLEGFNQTGVLIIVENLPFPFVRRAWQEACALRDAGYQVSVISGKGAGCEKSRETMEGIEIYRHSIWEASGPLGYLLEYAGALTAQFYLALKIYARHRFRVVHTWNPPDIMFLVGLFFRLFGAHYIFDHLDLNPELYLAKFGREDFFYRLICRVERAAFRTADVSLATNQSYREIAIQRGGKTPEQVFIVRVSPEPAKMRRGPEYPELKRGKEHLVVYLGVMGPQDGLDLLIESIEYIVNRKKRVDTCFTFIGSGTEVPRLKAMVELSGLESVVAFTGRIPGDELARYLSTADVGVAPDPLNPMNDKSTMGKILEYMSFELPVVLYELTEGRRSAADAALYARPNDPIDFAEKVLTLLESEPLRRELGQRGRKRIEECFNWETDKQELLKAYETALRPRSS